MRRVLIIEDDQIMAIALRDGLESENYSAVIETDGLSGLRAAIEKEFDLIVLDVMLPKLSGFDVCKQIRAAGKSVPVIMLTARSLEVEKVQGLKIGADDYMAKPCNPRELVARAKAVLRRRDKGARS